MISARSLLFDVEMLGRDWVMGKMDSPDISAQEKADLKKFDDECINYFGDEWESYGMTLISGEHFVDYAYDIFFDCYSIPKGADAYIDIEGFARDLRYDYSAVNLWGLDFYGLS